MPDPLKRHEALKSLSRDHHFGLLLSWKLRQGIRKGISVDRMSDYIVWSWQYNLSRHFEIEERAVFSVIPKNQLIQSACIQHQKIEQCIIDGFRSNRDIEVFAELLDDHIRFEERRVFEVIQTVANAEQLRNISKSHDFEIRDDYTDVFWNYDE